MTWDRTYGVQLASDPYTFFWATSTVVYSSSGLDERLGLEALFIAFNGYWPERGALLPTCTFSLRA
jgi:hypothetical protein